MSKKRQLRIKSDDNSLMEISNILERISQFESELPMLYLMQRPSYKETIFVPKVMSNECDLRMKYQQLKKETQKTWRQQFYSKPPPEIIMKSKHLTPKSPQKTEKSFSRQPILSVSAKPFVYKQAAKSKSAEKQYRELLNKLDLEQQFNETRSLIKKLNRSNLNKQVRFNTSHKA